MNTCLANMMQEHRLIEQVLGALETYVHQLQAGGPALPGVVARFARFFQQFADRCHHGKEEDRLFLAMNQHGFPNEYGPIAVMLAEHIAGRQHVKALTELGKGVDPLSPAQVDQVIEQAAAFIPLLRGHIQKEDNVLYPMAQQAIAPAALQQLDTACIEFDQQVIGENNLQELRNLAAELIAAFPPDPEKMAAHTACAGCCGH